MKKLFALFTVLGVLVSSAFAADAPRVYTIATEGAMPPYNFIGADGQPDGYDVAVAKAVDALLPDVEFKFIAVEWTSIFAGLEAGRYDLIVSFLGRNAEREKKYLYGDVPYNWNISALAFAKGRTDIHSLNDLIGKKVTVGLGGWQANALEKWNAEHGNGIQIVYNDGDISKMLFEIENGRVDATITSPVTGGHIAREQGLNVEFVLRDDVPITAQYWLFTKDERGAWLKERVDAALKQLLADGTLSRLSVQYEGADYSTREAVASRIGK